MGHVSNINPLVPCHTLVKMTYFGKQPEKSGKQAEVDGCKPSLQVMLSRHITLSLQ
jgi:hypothetical protein